MARRGAYRAASGRGFLREDLADGRHGQQSDRRAAAQPRAASSKESSPGDKDRRLQCSVYIRYARYGK